jgi:hypothetical protein
MRRALDDVAPGVLDRLEATVTRVVDDARSRWPVRTGRSRDGLEAHVTIAPGQTSIRGTVANAVDYAVYVRSGQRGLGGKSAVVELLRKPLRAAARELAVELADTVSTTLAGG